MFHNATWFKMKEWNSLSVLDFQGYMFFIMALSYSFTFIIWRIRLRVKKICWNLKSVLAVDSLGIQTGKISAFLEAWQMWVSQVMQVFPCWRQWRLVRYWNITKLVCTINSSRQWQVGMGEISPEDMMTTIQLVSAWGCIKYVLRAWSSYLKKWSSCSTA